MKRGFTLIELLVVIAIIGLVAALLLPVLSSSKAKAEHAVCLNNLKELGLANAMYMNDSHGFCLPYEKSGRGLWMGTLIDYQSKVDALRFCPMAIQTNTPRPQWGTADKAWNWAPALNEKRWYGSYGMNGWLYSNLTNLSASDQTNVFTRETGVTAPQSTPIFADSIWLDFWPRAKDLPAKDLYNGFEGKDNNMGRLTIPRHGGFSPARAPRSFNRKQSLPGAIDMCYYDGHVYLVKLEELWSLTWNKNWVAPATRPF